MTLSDNIDAETIHRERAVVLPPGQSGVTVQGEAQFRVGAATAAFKKKML